MYDQKIEPIKVAHISPAALVHERDLKKNQTDVLNIRCLVVDDDLVILKYVAKLLRSLGIKNVIISHQNPDLLYKLNSGLYNLLITDLEMPDLNGYDLVLGINKNQSQLKTIIMTGRSKNECREMMSTNLIDEWLFKPFGLKEMRSALSLLALI